MNEPLGFGAIERTESPTDWSIGSYTPPGAIPDVYMPQYALPIKMQAKQPSCGANSGAELKQLFDHKDLSEEYLWKKIKTFDGFPPEAGTTMDAIFKALKSSGICTTALLPNNTSVSVAEYASNTTTPDMDSDAAHQRISNYAFTFNPSFEQIKEAVYNFKAVILLMRVGSEWWLPSWHEKDILPLKTDKPISSGHFVVAYAYDKDYIYFINHWSDAWGRKGIGYFGADYASRVVEMGTAIDLSDITTPFKFLKNMKQGDKNNDVKELQKKLGLSADGIFGLQTKQAVIAFQIAHNLTSDGIVGPKTREVLNT